MRPKSSEHMRAHFVGECALWVLFAPTFGSQVPHLPLVNCGLARSDWHKNPSTKPTRGGDFIKGFKDFNVPNLPNLPNWGRAQVKAIQSIA